MLELGTNLYAKFPRWLHAMVYRSDIVSLNAYYMFGVKPNTVPILCNENMMVHNSGAQKSIDLMCLNVIPIALKSF
mgnify:CR=1 FL=1